MSFRRRTVHTLLHSIPPTLGSAHNSATEACRACLSCSSISAWRARSANKTPTPPPRRRRPAILKLPRSGHRQIAGDGPSRLSVRHRLTNDSSVASSYRRLCKRWRAHYCSCAAGVATWEWRHFRARLCCRHTTHFCTEYSLAIKPQLAKSPRNDTVDK